MQTQKIEMTKVIYNAATQAFEALVTVHDFGQVHKYPCAIEAPISMSFERAAAGLTRQAERRHGRKVAASDAPRFVPLRPVETRTFNAARWLRSFTDFGMRRAA